MPAPSAVRRVRTGGEPSDTATVQGELWQGASYEPDRHAAAVHSAAAAARDLIGPLGTP